MARVDLAFQQVHRRRAHEVGDEKIGRHIVDLARGADLLQFAVLQNGDLGRERHRLDLIVSDIDDRRSGRLMKALDLDAHVDAKLCVEVRERLVEQEDARLSNQRATHRHALALAAGELARPAIQKMLDLQRLGDLRHRLVALGLRHAAHLHAERHVLRDRHIGIERVGLKHHRDVALGGVQIVDRVAVDANVAGADRFKPRDRVEKRRFSAARRADQNEKAALVERKVDALQDLQRAEALAQAIDFEKGHRVNLSPRRPSVRARSSGPRRCRRTRSAQPR